MDNKLDSTEYSTVTDTLYFSKILKNNENKTMEKSHGFFGDLAVAYSL